MQVYFCMQSKKPECRCNIVQVLVKRYKIRKNGCNLPALRNEREKKIPLKKTFFFFMYFFFPAMGENGDAGKVGAGRLQEKTLSF